VTFSKKDTQHHKIAIILSVFMLCRDSLIVMLNVVMLNAVGPVKGFIAQASVCLAENMGR
jgi:hypothetical protein